MSKRANGEGTIFYRKDRKKYYGYFWVELSDGTKKREAVTPDKSRKVVSDRLTEALSKINNNTYVLQNTTTLISIIIDYVEQLYNSNKISDNAYLAKTTSINRIKKLKISNMPIQEITIKDINQDLATMINYSNSVIAKDYALISMGFNQALLYNIIPNNPFSIKNAIIKPKSNHMNKSIEALSIDEQLLFVNQLSKSNDKYNDIFFILIYTGMRVGEVLALHSNDIDLENKIIKVSKTLTKDKNGNVILGKTTKTYAGTREIPILATLIPILENYTIKNDYCFKFENKWVSPSTINTHFKKICKDANIRVIVNSNKTKLNKNREKIKVNLKTSNVNTHMLRHTFATRCIEAGMTAVTLSRILGHTDIQTTLNTYTSVFNEFKKDEMNILENYLSKINGSNGSNAVAT